MRCGHWHSGHTLPGILPYRHGPTEKDSSEGISIQITTKFDIPPQ